MLSLLATGGTIACTPGPDGLEPTLRAADLLACLGSALPCRVRPQDVFLLDSSNVQPVEWCALARAVREALDASDGAVITHGTDTMAYTAAALSFLLAGVQKPVILTGSQLPPGHPLSDARLNLLRAIAAAQAGVAGEYVCFGDRLISGVRCVKTHTTAMDAFSSVNAPLAGRFDVEGYENVRISLDPQQDCYIAVLTDEGLTRIFNLMSEAETEEFYAEIEAALKS